MEWPRKVNPVSPYFIWEENSRLLLEKGSAAPVVLSQAGSYPAMAVTSVDQSPIVAWESTINGVQTILAQALK